MERSDANSPVAEPPLGSEQKVIYVGGTGIGLAGIAALIGAIFPSGPGAATWVNDNLAPLRAILSLLGMLFAGAAITLRPKWIGSWLLASAASLAAGGGFPNSWFTFSFVALVFAALAAIGALLAALPFAWRIAVVSAFPLVHFSGILTAVLGPPPAPELVNNASVVIYRPYLQFAYMYNAYQFYSPEPGSASELWFCIEFETRKDDPVHMEALQYDEFGVPRKGPNGGLLYTPMVDQNDEPKGVQIYDSEGKLIFQPEKDRFGNDKIRPIYDEDYQPQYIKTYKWIKMPRRPRDRKDPLFQTYYRRLSLTEMVAQGPTPFSRLPASVQLDIRQRRATVTPEFNLVPREKQIPLNESEWNLDVQFVLPTEHIQQVLLPSYVRHIAKEYQNKERPIAGIKVYRVLHWIMRIELFAGFDRYEDKDKSQPWGAYDPHSYLPYFMGDFDVNGKLRNPSDPMLYWIVPIERRPEVSPTEFPKRLTKMRDYKRLYVDYLSVHAGSNHMDGELEK